MPMRLQSVARVNRSWASRSSSSSATRLVVSWKEPTTRTASPPSKSATPTERAQIARPSARVSRSSRSHPSPPATALATAALTTGLDSGAKNSSAASNVGWGPGSRPWRRKTSGDQ